jgi:hypothetical protein
VHVMRYEVVDLVIREISLFFACIDQLFYVVKLVVKSQEVSSKYSMSTTLVRVVRFLKGGNLG